MRRTSSLPAERLGLRVPMVQVVFLARLAQQAHPEAFQVRPARLALQGPRGRKVRPARPFLGIQGLSARLARMPRRPALQVLRGHPEEQPPVRSDRQGRQAPTGRKVCPARLVLLVLLAPMPRVDLAVLALPGSQA